MLRWFSCTEDMTVAHRTGYPARREQHVRSRVPIYRYIFICVLNEIYICFG